MTTQEIQEIEKQIEEINKTIDYSINEYNNFNFFNYVIDDLNKIKKELKDENTNNSNIDDLYIIEFNNFIKIGKSKNIESRVKVILKDTNFTKKDTNIFKFKNKGYLEQKLHKIFTIFNFNINFINNFVGYTECYHKIVLKILNISSENIINNTNINNVVVNKSYLNKNELNNIFNEYCILNEKYKKICKTYRRYSINMSKNFNYRNRVKEYCYEIQESREKEIIGLYEYCFYKIISLWEDYEWYDSDDFMILKKIIVDKKITEYEYKYINKIYSLNSNNCITQKTLLKLFNILTNKYKHLTINNN